MSRGKACPVTRALLEMLPGAEVITRSERSWHSATFSGSRITLCLHLPAAMGEAGLAQFRQALPGHDFALKKGLVADIAIVEERQMSDTAISMTIEALLLDD
jgi:hypothetical protein